MFTLTESGVKEIDVTEEQEGSFIMVDKESLNEGAANGAKRERWSISKDQAIKLGRVGVLLEEAFAGPRDIEWAFYKVFIIFIKKCNLIADSFVVG